MNKTDGKVTFKEQKEPFPVEEDVIEDMPFKHFNGHWGKKPGKLLGFTLPKLGDDPTVGITKRTQRQHKKTNSPNRKISPWAVLPKITAKTTVTSVPIYTILRENQSSLPCRPAKMFS